MLWAEVTHYNELLLALRQPEHLGQDLRDGWSAYFIRELLITVLTAAILAAVGLALLRRRWQLIVGGIVLAAVVAGGVDALAVNSAAHGCSSSPRCGRSTSWWVVRR